MLHGATLCNADCRYTVRHKMFRSWTHFTNCARKSGRDETQTQAGSTPAHAHGLSTLHVLNGSKGGIFYARALVLKMHSNCTVRAGAQVWTRLNCPALSLKTDKLIRSSEHTILKFSTKTNIHPVRGKNILVCIT